MAIVQISRIQVRRGRKNGATSIPQLSSGEFGWAVDTQELFIGNGSVQEGAPFVGNTRILTEKSNIFDLISQYQFKKNDPTIQTGFSPASPVSRTLQDRLDDTVSIRSFITPEDIASGDYTDAIQRALDQLYLNDATKGTEESRVPLVFEAGVYPISRTLHIPPYAHLIGAGKDKTVILGGDIVVATTIGDDAQAGDDHSTYTPSDEIYQPRYIRIEGMTFQNTGTTKTVFEALVMKNSTVDNVKFKGAWTTGTSPNTNNNGISLIAISDMWTCKDNVFTNCDVEDVAYGIDSTYDIERCIFRDCFVTRCLQGVTFGWAVDGVTSGVTYGPRFCKIENSRFYFIDDSAIQFGRRLSAPDTQYCYGNISQTNTFNQIGGGSLNPTSPVIEFLAAGNVSTNDYFDRAFDLVASEGVYGTTPYAVSEFSGFTNADHKYNYRKNVASSTNAMLLKLPGNVNAVYKIHYLYINESVEVMRRGSLTVSIKLTGNPFTSEAHLTDEFDGSGSLSAVENLVFQSILDTATDSVSIEYSTTQGNGVLSFWYEVLGQ
jgi:hypothetical protein